MSDVVLRCANCGTTQATAGECEACHEGAVRYFCPNHSPGRWLDAPRCAECEAREARERATARRTPPRSPAATVPPPRSSRRPTPPPRRVEDPWAAPREPSDVDPFSERDEPVRWPVESPPDWPFGRVGGAPGAPRVEIRLPRIPLLGCVGQLIKLVIFLVILAALATCWFFSGSGIIIGALPDVVPAVGKSPTFGDSSPLPRA